MKEEYREAFSEVEQILKLMPTNLSNKIPMKFKNIITLEKSKTYIPQISEPFEECELKEETKIILAVIYRDFLCSKEEREELLERDRNKLLEFEEELREKYNPDNLFKNKNNSSENIQDNISTETAMVEYKEKNFLQKLFDKIKSLFRRN